MKKFIFALILMVTFSALTLASEPTQKNNDFFPLEDVKPGMKAIGKTIFAGGQTEEFEVEILGKFPSIVGHPGRSLIIMRLKSPQTDRSGVFAGMSGSPVFINGKLLGAIAYAFPLSKEPIGAITPIEDMVSIFENKEKTEHGNSQGMSFQELALASQSLKSGFLQSSSSFNSLSPVPIGDQAIASVPALAPFMGQSLMPIATPLSISGIDPSVFSYFANYFQPLGFQPVLASGSSSMGPMEKATEDTLTPGKTVGVELVRGDLAIAAFGTVTWRDKEKIYAFGHPFFAPGGIGGTVLPMTEGSVVTVVPSIANSFKLSKSEKLVGSMVQDRATGIYGQLGIMPKLIPIKVNVTTSRGKEQSYKMELVSDSFLTPLLVQFSTLNAILSTERSLGDLSINLESKIKLKAQSDITFGNSFSQGAAYFAASLYTGYPISVLYSSGFPIEVESVEVTVKATDKRASGTLTAISVDKSEIKRGEKLILQAFARNEKGETYTERIPVTIPSDAPLGKVNLTVGDGTVMAGLEQRVLINANPKDLKALINSVNNLPRNDRLYVRLHYSDTGAIVNNQALPSLPPSMMATLESSRSTSSYIALPIATLLTQEIPPTNFLINGQQTISIKVIQ
ncbi:MAG: hypothetical protein HY819_02640 [Acidobacteria bacterium]|nr:hypothetical protein [Acidobacteriota bacterium]